ncbi:hypothetical protein XU18_3043 [Perkinsela sp. CCAP 1560/4]|nr:hypothetical protein XU18_3043 [Perkinsela sp. CCAP 1560/4]|eukprot:KNH06106.1 hypothetical protein XU18_3043 [Perkinsela sp. CCAP 1560/4]
MKGKGVFNKTMLLKHRIWKFMILSIGIPIAGCASLGAYEMYTLDNFYSDKRTDIRPFNMLFCSAMDDPLETTKRRSVYDAPWDAYMGLRFRSIPK